MAIIQWVIEDDGNLGDEEYALLFKLTDKITSSETIIIFGANYMLDYYHVGHGKRLSIGDGLTCTSRVYNITLRKVESIK